MMKVGLVRHFKVKMGMPKGLVGPDEFVKWFDAYDAAEVEIGEVDLGGVEWKRCYASDLPRALQTAETIYPGVIKTSPALRELRAYPFFKRPVRLPFILWGILVRIAWAIDHPSQLERQSDVEKRLGTILDEILQESGEDVLIVSHGACMMTLRKELLKRGFTGPKFNTPDNGKLYLYEN